jgi:hypothetical protein
VSVYSGDEVVAGICGGGRAKKVVNDTRKFREF